MDVNTRRETHKGRNSRDARNKREPTDASAGTPIAQYRHQHLMGFLRNMRKRHQNGKKVVTKGTKRVKIPLTDSSQSNSYQTIRSSMWLVQ